MKVDARSGINVGSTVGQAETAASSIGGIWGQLGSNFRGLRDLWRNRGVNPRLKEYDPKKDVKEELGQALPLIFVIALSRYQRKINAELAEGERKVEFLNAQQMEWCRLMDEDLTEFHDFLSTASGAHTDDNNSDVAPMWGATILGQGQDAKMTPDDRFLFEVDATSDEIMDLVLKYGLTIGPDGGFIAPDSDGRRTAGIYKWQEFDVNKKKLFDDLVQPLDESNQNGPSKWDSLVNAVEQYLVGEREQAFGQEMATVQAEHDDQEGSMHQTQEIANLSARDRQTRRARNLALTAATTLVTSSLGTAYGYLSYKFGLPIPPILESVFSFGKPGFQISELFAWGADALTLIWTSVQGSIALRDRTENIISADKSKGKSDEYWEQGNILEESLALRFPGDELKAAQLPPRRKTLSN